MERIVKNFTQTLNGHLFYILGKGGRKIFKALDAPSVWTYLRLPKIPTNIICVT